MSDSERIDAQCLAMLDQRRAYISERQSDLFRIGLNGPQPEDKEFVQCVFLVLTAELFMRHGDTPTGGA